MGRAQVVQAQACRLDPDVRMNPILLKPNSDTGSQVIVMGSPVGNMDVMEYVRFKPKAFEGLRPMIHWPRIRRNGPREQEV
jgi:cobyric acid synthase